MYKNMFCGCCRVRTLSSHRACMAGSYPSWLAYSNDQQLHPRIVPSCFCLSMMTPNPKRVVVVAVVFIQSLRILFYPKEVPGTAFYGHRPHIPPNRKWKEK